MPTNVFTEHVVYENLTKYSTNLKFCHVADSNQYNPIVRPLMHAHTRRKAHKGKNDRKSKKMRREKRLPKSKFEFDNITLTITRLPHRSAEMKQQNGVAVRFYLYMYVCIVYKLLPPSLVAIDFPLQIELNSQKVLRLQNQKCHMDLCCSQCLLLTSRFLISVAA